MGTRSFSAVSGIPSVGSSPRVWGQECYTNKWRLYARIIPTRMGTSNNAYETMHNKKDHPHAYGDKRSNRPCVCQHVGSSPRVWGQETILQSLKSFCRIIPTRMGTSPKHTVCRKGVEDHPHAYGDKPITMFVLISSLGSSPRVWGQVYQKYDGNQPVRIIPTRMGTSTGRVYKAGAEEDHPHAYGDKRTRHHSSALPPGSSPRVWGQVHIMSWYTFVDRIIPTRMGTRRRIITLLASTTDHPHAYGDKSDENDGEPIIEGSSPRVWGQVLIMEL